MHHLQVPCGVLHINIAVIDYTNQAQVVGCIAITTPNCSILDKQNHCGGFPPVTVLKHSCCLRAITGLGEDPPVSPGLLLCELCMRQQSTVITSAQKLLYLHALTIELTGVLKIGEWSHFTVQVIPERG